MSMPVSARVGAALQRLPASVPPRTPGLGTLNLRPGGFVSVPGGNNRIIATTSGSPAAMTWRVGSAQDVARVLASLPPGMVIEFTSEGVVVRPAEAAELSQTRLEQSEQGPSQGREMGEARVTDGTTLARPATLQGGAVQVPGLMGLVPLVQRLAASEGNARTGSLSPELASELVQFVKIANTLPAGEGTTVLAKVAEGISTRAELAQANTVLIRMGDLPRSVQRAILREFSFTARAVTPAALSRAIERAERQTILRSDAISVVGAQVVPAAMAVALPNPTVRPIGTAPSRLQFGSHPLTALVRNLPEGSPERAETVALFKMLTATPARPANAAPMRVPEKARVDALVQRIFSLPEAVNQKAVQTFAWAWNHPHFKVRLAVVNLIREMISRAEKNSTQSEALPFLGELKALARDRQSIQVREEAIKVLLDMGGRQGRGREEMEALLAEIEFVPAVRRMLKAKDGHAVIAGLQLLAKGWRYLATEVKAEFAQIAMDLIERHPWEEVAVGALELLLMNYREVPFRVRGQILKVDLYEGLLRALSRVYEQAGRSLYAA